MKGTAALILSVGVVALLFIGLLRESIAGSDLTPPTSALALVPPAPDGENGWYISPIDTTITADDLESGVESINWRIDNENWQSLSFADTLNLVRNASFEESGSPISYWDLVGADSYATFSQDFTAAPSFGTKSAKIVSTGGGWHAFSNRGNFVVAEPSQNMTSSVWVKTEGVTGSVKYKVYLIYNDGQFHDQYVSASGSISGSTGWQKLSVNFVPTHPHTVGAFVEVGVDGAGTVWYDGVSISSSMTTPSVNFVLSTNGEHVLDYYSQDNAGNIETHKTLAYKIDTKAPTRWNTFSITEAGNNHTFIVTLKVSDATSGIDVSTAQFQYSVDKGQTWGYHSNIAMCGTAFIEGGWYDASTVPNEDGSHEVTVRTPAVDFCNSNWAQTKYIRFRVKDMAGNQGQSANYSINGAWIKALPGSIYSNNGIILQANSSISDLVGSAGLLSNATSEVGWYLENYDTLPFETYSLLRTRYPTTNPLPGGKLPTADGKYYVNGDFTIASATIPSNLSTVQNLSAVVFVNGDLNINSNYSLAATSGLIFVVKNDVTISNNVTQVDGFFIADGMFDAGTGKDALTIKGGTQADSYYLKRSLNSNNNTNFPAEIFVYEPKYLIVGRDQLFSEFKVSFTESN